MYDHTYSKSMDQPGKVANEPGKVANPARGQLNKENLLFSLSPFALEKLISRDGFGRPVPRRPAQSPHSAGLILKILLMVRSQ